MIIAIDPGIKGGIAMKMNNGIVHAWKMPNTVGGMNEWFSFNLSLATAQELEDFKMKNPGEGLPPQPVCYLEKVHSMPKQRPTAIWTFAENYGALKALLLAYGISRVDVEPKTWQKAIGATREAVPKGATPSVKERIKREAKKRIKEIVEAKYPQIKVTLETADALGILMYAEETKK